MWLPQTLRHWQCRLLAHTQRLVLFYAPRLVDRDRTLSLLALVNDSVRTALTCVPDALGGHAMLQTYSEWIAGIATDEQEQQQQQVEAEPSAAVSMAPTQLPSDSAVTAGSDNARSLQDVCELVMYRNDGLRRLNKSLVHQISQLESDLAHTHATLVYAQRTVAQLKELNAVRAKRLVVAALQQRDASTGSLAAIHHAQVSALTSESSRDTLKSAQDGAMDASSGVDSTSQATEQASSCSSSDGESRDSVDGQPPVQPREHQRTDEDADIDEPVTSSYCDLLALSTQTEREDTTWHRRALRRLAQEREQRRSARSECLSESSTPRRARFSFASSIELDSSAAAQECDDALDDALSYQELAAMRSSDADDDIVAWQRQSLHRLSTERAQRCSRTSAVSSASPTNSSTSTFGAFAGDEY